MCVRVCVCPCGAVCGAVVLWCLRCGLPLCCRCVASTVILGGIYVYVQRLRASNCNCRARIVHLRGEGISALLCTNKLAWHRLAIIKEEEYSKTGTAFGRKNCSVLSALLVVGLQCLVELTLQKARLPLMSCGTLLLRLSTMCKLYLLGYYWRLVSVYNSW